MIYLDTLVRTGLSLFVAATAVTACLLICILVASPVSAEVLVYGTNFNFSENVLPNNSYVHQGENISQGLYYQLGGVYGFSGQLAHWNNKWESGYGTPDQIVTLTSNPYANTYIDPEIFPEGKWFQWDGQYCTVDDVCTSGFGHGNAYVFAVVKQSDDTKTPKTISVPMVYHANISIQSGNETIEIPVTASVTVMVTETPVPIKDATTIVIPAPATPTPAKRDIAIVTPKAPVSIIVPVMSVIFGVGLVWKKKQK